MPKLLNQASFEIGENAKEAKDHVSLNAKKIGMVHGTVDKPGASFDVVIQDMLGCEQKRLSFKTENQRFGEAINLPIKDNYYIIKLENISGAKKVDIFLD